MKHRFPVRITRSGDIGIEISAAGQVACQRPKLAYVGQWSKVLSIALPATDPPEPFFDGDDIADVAHGG